MADQQIYATFPGVKYVKSATFTMTPGISPSVGVLECFPQFETIKEEGTLTFYAGEQKIEIPNCRIGRGAMVHSGNSSVLSLQILDYRWKWAYGRIDGEYNQRDRKNLVVDDTARDAYRLMEDCLKAMGVAKDKYDTSAVPPGINPHVEWIGTNPAKALADLCDELGFMVCPQLDGKIIISKIGEGADLSTTDAESIAPTVDPPEGPDKITVIGAATRYQALLHLEAVGLDLDGTIKLIDDLSYAPAADTNGVKWQGFAPELEITGEGREAEDKKRAAKATVFKWYRIKIDDDDPAFRLGLPMPNGAIVSVKSTREILPISGDLVETYIELGRERRKKARVYGTFYVGNTRQPRNSNQTRGPETSPGVYNPAWVDSVTSPINFPYQEKLATFPGEPSNFSIIEEFGIAQFPEPMVQAKDIAGSEYLVAADLWLLCSFNWRNASSDLTIERLPYDYHRYAYDHELPGVKHGTGAEIINKEAELQNQQYATYTPGGTLPIASWLRLRPLDDLDKAAKHYAEGAAQKYKTVEAADVTYIGLKEINLDGAIRQVTWSVGPDGVTTRAGRNTEPNPYVRQYVFNRFLEKMSTLARDPRALVPELPAHFIPVI